MVHIGPYGFICELLFMNSEDRRLRRRFRIGIHDMRRDEARGRHSFVVPPRSEVFDPSAELVQEVATRIDAKQAEGDPNDLWAAKWKMTWAMQPRCWEHRRQRRRPQPA